MNTENGHYYETNMHQENTYIFGEYRGKIDKLNYRLGVAMTRFYYNQSGKDKSTENYSFNPSYRSALCHVRQLLPPLEGKHL